MDISLSITITITIIITASIVTATIVATTVRGYITITMIQQTPVCLHIFKCFACVLARIYVICMCL